MVKRTLFFTNPAHLSFRNGQLVIKTESGETTRPIEDLGFIVLEHPRITFTQHIVDALARNNCTVIFCGGDYMPKAMILPLEAHQTQNQRFRSQVSAGKPLMKNLWMQTVKAKLKNQHALLELVGSEVNLRTLAEKVRSGDPENLEGMGAKRYWPELFGGDFKRERFGDSPNNLLNYGYAILRAVVARALTGSGLHPTLGIHHHNKYNAFCLADDIMEPYRPFVDREVLSMVEEGFDSSELTTEDKQRLLQIPHADCRIGEKVRPLMMAVRETSAGLAQCFLGEARKLRYATFAD